MTHVLLGALSALGFAVAVRAFAPRREAAFYALGLVVAAALYVVFALAADALGWVAIGAVGVIFFALFAALGLRASPLLLATGWALHVGWDAALHHAGTRHFVPSGYPALCLGFDLVLAAWIAVVRPRVGIASAAPVLGKIALRDGLILLATLLLWRADALWRGAGGPVETLLAATVGLATALCGYLAHEWGHLLGARASRSLVHLPASPWTVFLFRFDSDRNTRGRFLAMSCGGYAASALVVVLLVLVLPLETLAGRIALALTALGVVATAILELPPAWRVLRGGPIPRGAAYASGAEHAPGPS